MKDEAGPRSRIRYWAALTALIAGAISSGCSRPPENPSGKVSGTITFQGKPITQGTVLFELKGGGAGGAAALDLEGKFSLVDALPVGSYVIAVAPPLPNPDDVAKPGFGSAPVVKTEIPQKYRSPTTSDLSTEIKEGENPPLTLDLKP